MAADAEHPQGDQARALREQARAGVAAAVARQAASGLLKMTPPALLGMLSAAALIPLALAAPGAVGLAALGVAANVGSDIVSDVIGRAVGALRSRTGSPTKDQVEHELAQRLEQMLATDSAQARQLRVGLATVLRDVDAVGIALEVAVDSGNRAVQKQIAEAFAAASAEFTEFAFLLAGIDRAAAAIQRTLHRQDAERRSDRERMRLQSTQLMLIREEVAALNQSSSRHTGDVRWEHGSPYRGLLAFEADHAQIFYGREQTTTRLVGKLAERLSTAGVVLVTGPSGVGKSSILRAGLLPALARGLLPVPGSDRWPCLLLTPTRAPVDEFATHLAALGGSDPVTVRHALTESPGDAHLVVRQAVLASRGPDRARAVIVVDQFEEVFTLADETGQRQAFITALAAATTEPAGPHSEAPALLVIGVRGDFLDRCAAYPMLAEAMAEGQFVVAPMVGPDLLRVITGPAAVARLELEPGLADTVLGELGSRDGHGAGTLPLLSQAMLATWENREGNRLTISGYDRGGGIAHAVHVSAERVYDSLTSDQRNMADQLFRRMVIVSREGRLARRRASRAELYGHADRAGDVDAVLTAFAVKRLIMLDDTTAEISHDCLLEAWPRLRGWLRDDQAGQVLYSQLLDDSGDWHSHDRDPSFLYQGTRLATVSQARAGWESDPGRYPPLDESVKEFLAACEEAAAHARQSASRRRRWARVAVAGLTVLTLVASIAAVVAVRAADTATTRGRQALSRESATKSENLVSIDPITAGRLAVTAWDFAHTDEARFAMMNVLATQVGGILTGHTGPVHSVAFSPDGNVLATAGEDDAVRLWDVATYRQIGAPLAGRPGAVTSVVFSPDGETLACAGEDGTVRLWNTATRRQIGVPLAGHADAVLSVAFSPDGSAVVTGGSDGTVRLWDTATHEQIGAPLAGHAGAVLSVVFSPDGKTLASAGEDNTVRLWNTATRRPIGIPLDGHIGAVLSVAFSPDGKTLASAGYDNTVHLWDAATHEQIGAPLAGHTDNIYWVGFSPDGTTLASAGQDKTVRLWDAATHEQIGAPLAGHAGAVLSAAFSPDGKTLASAGGDDSVRLWDISRRRQIGAPLAGHAGYVSSVAFSPGGRTLASAGEDDTVRLWDSATHRQIGAMLTGDGNGVFSVAFSPDGKTLAAGGSGNIRLLDVATRRQIGTPLVGHVSGVLSVAFSPDGKTLATAGTDATTRLWDIPSHRQIGAPLDDSGAWAEFSPDGKTLATASLLVDGIVHLWDVATRRQIGVPLIGHTGAVDSVAFSPDGKTLATAADEDNTVRLWDVATHRQIGVPLAGHAGAVNSVAFSPDGETLASAGEDGTVRLWDVATHRQIGVPLAGHAGAVNSVRFSPDGRTLATGGEDDTIRLWNTATASDPESVLCALTGRSLNEQEWGFYLPGEPYHEVCHSPR